ncbi:hypothetical protein NDU88_001774 [Pleurodeles waltl]|uniref:Uncharacterized protein n=1 Tax=Pleurodeles waltl TaxID=8319 RepID=A0AAV7T157_PLEWA|nr:hypothetical protein NDU88_001774 [Pleurodeles waltl]
MNRVVRINNVVRPESSNGGKSSSDSESRTQSDSLCGDTREGDVWCLLLYQCRAKTVSTVTPCENPRAGPVGEEWLAEVETVGGGGVMSEMRY